MKAPIQPELRLTDEWEAHLLKVVTTATELATHSGVKESVLCWVFCRGSALGALLHNTTVGGEEKYHHSFIFIIGHVNDRMCLYKTDNTDKYFPDISGQ